VWQAVATGPGVSAWFVPTEIDGRESGSAVSHFGPGMDSHATITEWSPPYRFSAESRDDMGPDYPAVATEWIVEARSGGTCAVRVVHSWFAETDDWDSQFEGHEQGWLGFFRILRLYLTHFSGQPYASFRVMSAAPGTEAEVWEKLTGLLGLAGAKAGDAWVSPAGAPALRGVVEHVVDIDVAHSLLLRLDAPTPGILSLFAITMGEQAYLVNDYFYYGEEAAANAAHDEPLWQAWVNEKFPAAKEPGE
jgi:hypothetical protein